MSQRVRVHDHLRCEEDLEMLVGPEPRPRHPQRTLLATTHSASSSPLARPADPAWPPSVSSTICSKTSFAALQLAHRPSVLQPQARQPRLPCIWAIV